VVLQSSTELLIARHYRIALVLVTPLARVSRRVTSPTNGYGYGYGYGYQADVLSMPSHPNDERESLPLRCRNPASPGIPFLGLKVLSGAESSAVVRVSVSGAVSFVCYSAGF